MGSLQLVRGCIFAAEHDPSFGPAWISGIAEWKKCLAFNLGPISADTDLAHYFLATAEVWRFKENPQLMSEVYMIPGGKYGFFPQETAIEFSELWTVPIAKLKSHRAKVQGYLSAEDLQRCVEVASTARLLPAKFKRAVGLLPPAPS